MSAIFSSPERTDTNMNYHFLGIILFFSQFKHSDINYLIITGHILTTTLLYIIQIWHLRKKPFFLAACVWLCVDLFSFALQNVLYGDV